MGEREKERERATATGMNIFCSLHIKPSSLGLSLSARFEVNMTFTIFQKGAGKWNRLKSDLSLLIYANAPYFLRYLYMSTICSSHLSGSTNARTPFPPRPEY